jgi:hypothetical protein
MEYMIDRFQRLDPVAKLQYTLMIILGGTSILAALAPLPPKLKVAAVSVAFGITVGLWLAHLMTVVLPGRQTAAVDE